MVITGKTNLQRKIHFTNEICHKNPAIVALYYWKYESNGLCGLLYNISSILPTNSLNTSKGEVYIDLFTSYPVITDHDLF
jgi:hypothetical protein